MIKTLLKYIHIPFDDGENGGMDCFAFAKHFRKNEYNLDTPLAVPAFAECRRGISDIFDAGISSGDYHLAKTPRDGDLVLMSKKPGRWQHLGVYLNKGVIHCTKGINNYSGVQYLPLTRIDRIFPFRIIYTDGKTI